MCSFTSIQTFKSLSSIGEIWVKKAPWMKRYVLQIVWYPLFGQLYVLANHLRIDRSNPTAAIQSMKEVTLHFFLLTFCSLNIFVSVPKYCFFTAQVACAIVRNNLSLIIFPEGTRSKDGRLLPFKKAISTLCLIIYGFCFWLIW